MPSNKRQLQRALCDAWQKDPQRCEREGFPRTTKGLDAWQLLTLEFALNVPIGSTPRPMEPRRKRSNPSLDAAIQRHRDILRAAKEAVAAWAVKAEGRRDSIADAMIQLLGECATDRDGDDTLEVTGSFFEEYTELLHADHGGSVAHAVGLLGKAAHQLARVQNVRVVD
jgi:hypothetical protein